MVPMPLIRKLAPIHPFHVNNWYQFILHVNIWYQFLTHEKIWYQVLTHGNNNNSNNNNNNNNNNDNKCEESHLVVCIYQLRYACEELESNAKKNRFMGILSM